VPGWVFKTNILRKSYDHNLALASITSLKYHDHYPDKAPTPKEQAYEVPNKCCEFQLRFFSWVDILLRNPSHFWDADSANSFSYSGLIMKSLKMVR